MNILTVAQAALLLIATALDLSTGELSDSSGQHLEKRRGGGGRGSGSGSGGRGGNSGGRGGTSISPSYGGGRTYAGGSATSYAAGATSPHGITPSLLGGAALGFVAGSLFPYGAYAYPCTHPYYYLDPNTHHNDSLPVDCFCSPYNPCGCDDTDDQAAIGDMLKNSSVANVTQVNGTRTVFVNGTLPNGTDTSVGVSLGRGMMDQSGYWNMASIVAAMVWGI